MPFAILANILLVISVVLGLRKWPALPPIWRLALVQLILAVIIDTGGYLLINRYNSLNAALHNVYIVLEFLLLSVFCILQLRNSRLQLMLMTGIALATMRWIYVSTRSSLTVIDIPTFLLFCCLLFSFSTLALYQARYSDVSLARNPFAVFNVSSLLYFGCIVPLFCFYNYWVAHDRGQGAIFYNAINNFAAMLRYALVASTFLILNQKNNLILNSNESATE